MSIKNILFFAIILMSLSCKRNEYQKKIIGDWKLVGIVFNENGVKSLHDPYPGDCLQSGYNFFSNDSCDNKIGFLIHAHRSKGMFKPRTIYKLSGDSVSIFNNVDSIWEGFRIQSIIADTIYAYSRFSKNVYYKYIKQHYSANTAVDFDQIILTNYSTWGPGSSISIDKNGEVVARYHQSKGDVVIKTKQKNDNNGQFIEIKDGYVIYVKHQLERYNYYTAKTSSGKFSEILNGFQKIDFDHLRPEYSGNTVDGPETSFAFIKNGKVVKNIKVDKYTGPFELTWAYLPLQYLDDQLKMDSVSTEQPSADARFFGFENKHQFASVSPSMFFYLSTLLRQAKQTSAPFNSKYDVPFDYSADVFKMSTDGQLYRITWKNGSVKTYDIGFNFLTVNADVIRFKNKTATE
jgi:hypothetical protein